MVASFGFVPVIHPLLQGLLPDAPVVAPALFSGWRDRAAGKWHLLKARFDEASLRRAVFLTDHADHDADVVSEVQTPIIRRWPEARFIPACERTYAPFRYTFKGKHAGRNHLLRVFLGMDTLALMLASLPATSAPLSGATGYFFLTLSFFLVYEIGYHENDVIAAEREREPILTDARLRELGGMVEWQAWGIAILIALPGLFLLAHQGIPTWSRGTWQSDLPWLVALWLGALVVSRLVFAAFNRIEETTRTLLYLPLQATKGLGIVLLLGLPVTVAGIALLIAQAVSRWIPYVIYRTSSVRWQTPTRLYRLILLVMVFIAMLPVTGLWSDPLWATALVFGWCAIESRRELWQAWQRSHWLKQPVAAVGLLWVLEVAKIGGASLG